MKDSEIKKGISYRSKGVFKLVKVIKIVFEKKQIKYHLTNNTIVLAEDLSPYSNLDIDYYSKLSAIKSLEDLDNQMVEVYTSKLPNLTVEYCTKIWQQTIWHEAIEKNIINIKNEDRRSF